MLVGWLPRVCFLCRAVWCSGGEWLLKTGLVEVVRSDERSYLQHKGAAALRSLHELEHTKEPTQPSGSQCRTLSGRRVV